MNGAQGEHWGAQVVTLPLCVVLGYGGSVSNISNETENSQLLSVNVVPSAL